MRIVAGRFRGRKLAALGKGDPGAHLRPTTDRVRESLFNVLTHLDVLDGVRVLDLFAGTGALGLEALSRGAHHATFVDDGRKALALLAENIRLTGAAEETTVLRRDALRPGQCSGPACDLVFLDPPYGKGLGEKALAAVTDRGWLTPKAVVVWEESVKVKIPRGFTQLDARAFGGTNITILQRSGHDQAGDL